jgi:hypothetical protein
VVLRFEQQVEAVVHEGDVLEPADELGDVLDVVAAGEEEEHEHERRHDPRPLDAEDGGAQQLPGALAGEHDEQRGEEREEEARHGAAEAGHEVEDGHEEHRVHDVRHGVAQRAAGVVGAQPVHVRLALLHQVQLLEGEHVDGAEERRRRPEDADVEDETDLVPQLGLVPGLGLPPEETQQERHADGLREPHLVQVVGCALPERAPGQHGELLEPADAPPAAVLVMRPHSKTQLLRGRPSPGGSLGARPVLELQVPDDLGPELLRVRRAAQRLGDADVVEVAGGEVQQELGRVHGDLRDEAQRGEVVHAVPGLAVVDGVPVGDEQQLVEHVEHPARRLVDRRDDRPPRLRPCVQHRWN